jgi:transposase-like protein
LTKQQALLYYSFSEDKMSRSTISAFQLFQKFPNAESARTYLEGRLWPNGTKCPSCSTTDRIGARKNGYYRCGKCKLDFTVRTGTIFERSHVPLHKWIYAMYLLVTSRKGISSLQLAKEIGITQKSAWFVLHRLREACGKDFTMLKGIVEVDEVYLGGLESNKHMKQRVQGVPKKTAVVAMRERNGRTKAVVPETVSSMSLEKIIRDNVEPGSTIHTDEFMAYRRVGKSFNHGTVNHLKGEYSKNGVTTNGIESVFAVLKRGLHGVYHHASEKHMARYVDEFTFRLNDGNVKRHTWDRLDSFVSAVSGIRLTYERLVV